MPVHMLGPAAPATIALPFSVSACPPDSRAQRRTTWRSISLDELMNIRAPHTYRRAQTGEHDPVGIFDRDILIIDRGREAEKGR